MKLLTSRGQAKIVKDLYYAQYFVDGEWKSAVFNTEERYKQLCDLGDNPNPADIDRIIGNVTWTRVPCLECGDFVERAIQFGRGEKATTVCFPCLKKVFTKLFK